MRKKNKKNSLRKKKLKKNSKNGIISPFLFFTAFIFLFSLTTLIMPVGAYNEKINNISIGLPKINLDKIQMFIDNKKLSLNDTINMETLKKLKIISKNSQKLKILGKGEIKNKINIQADLISKSASEKLDKIGGSVQINKK